MQNLDLTIFRGIDNRPILIVFWADFVGGTQVDLNGWSVFSQGRTTPNSRPFLDLVPVILPTGTVLYGTTGPGRVKLADFTKDQTNAMSVEQLGGWDIILQDPSGVRSGDYVGGKLTIANKYTQL